MILNGKMQTAVRNAVVDLLQSEDETIRVRALEALAKVMAADSGASPEGDDGTEGEERVSGGLETERARLRGLTPGPSAVMGEVLGQSGAGQSGPLAPPATDRNP